MPLNMVLVQPYFSRSTIPTNHLTFIGNLLPRVPVLSAQLNKSKIEKETLPIVHAFQKFDQVLFGKSGITVHSDHKPLETIFKCPLASAPHRLQSMMPTLQRYSFQVE